MDDSSVIKMIRERFEETGTPAQIPLLKGKNGNRTFDASLKDNGIDVSNLDKQSFLPWSVFNETVALLGKKGGRAEKGDAMKCKLGEPGLPLDSVEGHVAHKVYHKNVGDSVFRRITPIACILIWAGICVSGRGELIINSPKVDRPRQS